MKGQPKIRILPDQVLGRDATVGQVAEYEVDEQGVELRALVTWTELASYRHSRTALQTQWLPIDQTERIDDVTYDRVPRTVVATQPAPTVPADAPQDWLAGVPAPSAADWKRTATLWLFEQLPPGYRSHQVLQDHPVVLLQMARAHLRLVYTEDRARLQDLSGRTEGRAATARNPRGGRDIPAGAGAGHPLRSGGRRARTRLALMITASCYSNSLWSMPPAVISSGLLPGEGNTIPTSWVAFWKKVLPASGFSLNMRAA